MKRISASCCVALVALALLSGGKLWAQTAPAPLLDAAQSDSVRAFCQFILDNDLLVLPNGLTAAQFKEGCVVATFFLADARFLAGAVANLQARVALLESLAQGTTFIIASPTLLDSHLGQLRFDWSAKLSLFSCWTDVGSVTLMPEKRTAPNAPGVPILAEPVVCTPTPVDLLSFVTADFAKDEYLSLGLLNTSGGANKVGIHIR